MEKLSEVQDIDQRHFWHMVNKKNKSRVHPIRDDNGNMLTDPNQIRKAWTAYYENLYSMEMGEEFEETFRKEVQRELINITMSDNCFLEYEKISYSETKIHIKKLKNKKDRDNITAKHFKFGGKILAAVISLIHNEIIKVEKFPTHFKKGLIVPIPKPNKDFSVLDNNRGITLLPVIYKLFENILLERESIWPKQKNVTHDFQGAGQEKCSRIHTSMLVQEAVAYNVN